MIKVVIIGGGWAGCSSAVTARKTDAEVILIEKSDVLLGCGLASGITKNNGRYTATEELKYLGARELLEIIDNVTIHKNVNFPGHYHANLYDPRTAEPMIRETLKKMDVDLHMQCRVQDVISKNKKSINGIILSDETVIKGDVFIDATGSAGPMGNCLKYGKGCSTCILGCPSFGPRTSISARAGIKDIVGSRDHEKCGAFSGSCELIKKSLNQHLRARLEKKGVLILPIPNEDVNMDHLDIKACQQYGLPEFGKNLILLDTGTHVKMMKPFYPIENLRKIQGLERAMHACPQRSDANSIRFLSRAPRNNALKVSGLDNLFCAGEKSGFFVGCVEAIVTGFLAGYNAINFAKGEKLLKIPESLSIGDIIAYENECVRKGDHKNRYTFSGGIYFQRMEKNGLYTTDKDKIRNRTEKVLKDECR
ncbi:MAG: tRNA (uracil-5-)-methyltransferase Gid [Methanobacterium sp. PtaU1.Bin242]|nr:MAG: tRNA (uracil-5-)-methyltransferase Gid [Methanobacterium sp. PtaU1.Bin242]